MESEATLFYSLILESLAFLVALLFCALFSFLETSVTALRLFQLKELASTTDKYQSLFHTLENAPHQILITMLITNNLANVTAAALSTDITEKIFHHLKLSSGMGFTLGIGIATTALLIFGEVIPKNIAKIHGEKVFKSTLWIINLNYYLFYPIVTVL